MLEQHFQTHGERRAVSASDRLVESLLDLVVHHLDKGMPAALALARQIAVASEHKQMISQLQDWWKSENSAAWRQRLGQFRFNPTMLRSLVLNFAIRGYWQGIEKRKQVAQKLGFLPPSFLLLDPTEACNLRCRGCWAGRYAVRTLPWEIVDRIIREAKELGQHWMVLSGGEPFAYKHLFDMLEKHPDMFFMAYTNGTLITDEVADHLARLGNLSPCVSLEGFKEETDWRRGEGVYDKVMATMDRLRERGMIFGASVTVTSRNVKELFSDAFIDHLIDKGVFYLWSFHYIPIGRDPDTTLMLSPEQRAWLYRRVRELRSRKPIFIADFWNDGEYVGGCIAGGRQYVHINANGDVEPCAFVHFSTVNVRDVSLLEALRSPLFAAYRSRQPFHPNLLTPCPIIDHPEALRAMVAESDARPTHDGADHILGGKVAAFLDQRAAAWQVEADALKPGSNGAPAASQPVVAARSRG